MGNLLRKTYHEVLKQRQFVMHCTHVPFRKQKGIVKNTYDVVLLVGTGKNTRALPH